VLFVEEKIMGLRATTTAGVFCIALLLIASSCAHPISKQLRQEAQKDNLPLATVLADPAACKGRIVLWGGKVIEVTNISDGTEIIVLETPLDFLGVPESAQESRGRFIARSPKFLDPAIYTAERDITLAGEVVGAEEKELGKTKYKYPVVLIKELYLWEKSYSQNSDYWYAPYWGPYSYGPGPYYHERGHHH
jgi:outer membrane lipoprotein